MLLEEFLKPMGLTQRNLANAINVPYQRINEIINGRRALHLARL
jgi:addiction module HigA family antidote